MGAKLYIDPGSGSMLFQVLIATGVGALITFRKFLRATVASILSKIRGSAGNGAN